MQKTLLEKLHAIEEAKVIYKIVYRNAGIAFQFYEVSRLKSGEDFTARLVIEKYYSTFEEAVEAEFAKLPEPEDVNHGRIFKSEQSHIGNIVPGYEHIDEDR